MTLERGHHLSKRAAKDAEEDECSSLPSAKKARLSNADRLAASRERNRMHARRTRERKKARLLDLQGRFSELQDEERRLQDRVEECDLAKLLLCLGSGGGMSSPSCSDTYSVQGSSMGDDASEDDADASRDADVDDEGADSDGSCGDSEESLLGSVPPSTADLTGLAAGDRERLRRERNRLHARKTRLRKKLVFEALERKVRICERRVVRLRGLLAESAGALALSPPSPSAAAATAAAAGRDIGGDAAAPDLVQVLMMAAEETNFAGDGSGELVASCARLDICAKREEHERYDAASGASTGTGAMHSWPPCDGAALLRPQQQMTACW